MKNRMDYGLSGVRKKSVVLFFVWGFVLFFVMEMSGLWQKLSELSDKNIEE